VTDKLHNKFSDDEIKAFFDDFIFNYMNYQGADDNYRNVDSLLDFFDVQKF